MVDRFVEKSAENGMDVFRVFDALNDVRNVRQAIKAVRRVGKHAQGTICYTESPLHTVEGYVQLARDLMDLECDSLCLKDMAALLKPQPAYDIVKAIKDDLGTDVRIHVHCHATTGVTLVSLMKAIEAGADVVDTAISSLSLGPGHNPTESLVAMLDGTPLLHRPGRRLPGAHPRPLRQGPPLLQPVHVGDHRRRHRHLRQPDPRRHDLEHGEPVAPAGRRRPAEGGAGRSAPGPRRGGLPAAGDAVLANRRHPGRLQRADGSLQGVDGRVRRSDAGLLRRDAGERDPEIVALAQAQTHKEPITVRPADLLEPEWDELAVAAEALEGDNGSDEDVLTYAMFPQVAPVFFAKRPEGPRNVGLDPAEVAASGNRTEPVPARSRPHHLLGEHGRRQASPHRGTGVT